MVFVVVLLLVVVVAAVVLILCLLGIFVYFIKQYYMGILFYVLLGFTYLNPPIVNGVLSQRLDEKEQGIGLGVLHAIKGITWGIAPITFAFLYDYFDNMNFLKTMPYIFATGFVLCGYPVLICPLRNALNKYDDQQLQESIKSKFQQENSGQDKRYSRLSQLYPDAMLRSELDIDYE